MFGLRPNLIIQEEILSLSPTATLLISIPTFIAVLVEFTGYSFTHMPSNF